MENKEKPSKEKEIRVVLRKVQESKRSIKKAAKEARVHEKKKETGLKDKTRKWVCK